MKLEVGMFIRTPLGIDKIIYLRIQDEYGCNYDTQLEHNLFINNEREHISIDGECFEKEEIKTSYNIIDLIEVGDYLNGFKVSKIERYDTNTIIKIGNSTFNVLKGEKIYTPSYDNNNYYEKIEKLKSIVTKEQFSSMEYRLGDDK